MFNIFEDVTSKNILRDICGLPVDNGSHWHVRYPKRAVMEIHKMSESTNAQVFFNGESLEWQEEIHNNFGTRFVISIMTSNDYPFVMPKVFILESDIDYHQGIHLYADGSLCLMHPDAYSSDKSILEFRNAACVWCWAIQVYIESDEWPTAEHEHERR